MNVLWPPSSSLSLICQHSNITSHGHPHRQFLASIFRNSSTTFLGADITHNKNVFGPRLHILHRPHDNRMVWADIAHNSPVIGLQTYLEVFDERNGFLSINASTPSSRPPAPPRSLLRLTAGNAVVTGIVVVPRARLGYCRPSTT